MCPACISALYLMAAGVATTSISGAAAIFTAKQLRKDIRSDKEGSNVK